MYSRSLLNEADHLRLQTLLDDETSTPRLNAANKETLRQFLLDCDIAKTRAGTHDRVGLYDSVTLVSPADSRDWYKLRIGSTSSWRFPFSPAPSSKGRAIAGS
jgi:hypothetical protein